MRGWRALGHTANLSARPASGRGGDGTICGSMPRPTPTSMSDLGPQHRSGAFELVARQHPRPRRSIVTKRWTAYGQGHGRVVHVRAVTPIETRLHVHTLHPSPTAHVWPTRHKLTPRRFGTGSRRPHLGCSRYPHSSPIPRPRKRTAIRRGWGRSDRSRRRKRRARATAKSKSSMPCFPSAPGIHGRVTADPSSRHGLRHDSRVRRLS
jgi:hypothetical protein